MKIGRHGLREHIRFMLPAFGLITAVWILRLILDAAGSPAWIIRITSVSVADAVALLLTVLAIHFRRFGGYASVVTASLLLSVWSEFLIIIAILVAVWSGIVNIYTAPQYSYPGNDPNHVRHIYAHLTFGVGIGSLSGAAMGSLLLWFLRTLVPLAPPPALPRDSPSKT